MRIEPHPIPKIAVFMNRAKTWSNNPTKETQFYMREVGRACEETANSTRIEAKFMDTWVRERVAIKRAITGGGVPHEVVPDFMNLWKKCVDFVG
jgi:chromosome partitioning protein